MSFLTIITLGLIIKLHDLVSFWWTVSPNAVFLNKITISESLFSQIEQCFLSLFISRHIYLTKTKILAVIIRTLVNTKLDWVEAKKSVFSFFLLAPDDDRLICVYALIRTDGDTHFSAYEKAKCTFCVNRKWRSSHSTSSSIFSPPASIKIWFSLKKFKVNILLETYALFLILVIFTRKIWFTRSVCDGCDM